MSIIEIIAGAVFMTMTAFGGFLLIGILFEFLVDLLIEVWKLLNFILDVITYAVMAILFVVFFPITVPLFLWYLKEEYEKEEALKKRARILQEIEDLQKQIEASTPRSNPFESPSVVRQTDYTSDWGSVSNRYKRAKGWRCEHCGVYCGGPGDKPLLHVHHWDRNPQNNRESNLVALCIQCHSRQPGAGHKRLRTASKKDGRWQRITKLRGA